MIAFSFQPDWAYNAILWLGFLLVIRALNQDFAAMRRAWKWILGLSLLCLLLCGRWSSQDDLPQSAGEFHRPATSSPVTSLEAERVLFQIFLYQPKNGQLLLAEEKIVPKMKPRRDRRSALIDSQVPWPDFPRLAELRIPQPIGFSESSMSIGRTQSWGWESIGSGSSASWKNPVHSGRWSSRLQAQGKGGKHGRAVGMIYLPVVTYLRPDEVLVKASQEELLAQFPQLRETPQSPVPRERNFFTWVNFFGNSIWAWFCFPALFMSLKQRSPWYFLRALAVGLFVLLILEFYLKSRDPSALTWFLR